MILPRNPWTKLPLESPFVLSEDIACVNTYNATISKSNPNYIVVDSVIPEPFVGDVHSASVIILLLNPGLDENNDPQVHADPDFRKALLDNLEHRESNWPFYFFNPLFEKTPGGKYWKGKTKNLAAEFSYSDLSKRLAAIEWFPYKSRRYGGCTVPSQQYSFALVRAAIQRNATIVVARSLAKWEASVPELRQYEHILTLSSSQNVVLSSNNLKYNGEKVERAWARLVEAITYPGQRRILTENTKQ